MLIVGAVGSMHNSLEMLLAMILSLSSAVLFAVGDRTHINGRTDEYKALRHKQCIVPVDNAKMSSLDKSFNDTQHLRLAVKVTDRC
jgi:hypothetical protein